MKSLELYKPDNSASVRLSRIFSKILPRQKDNLNSILISIRRNDAIKRYNSFAKKEGPKKLEKFTNAYNLYIDSINEYIMNKVYKRVRHEISTEYEKTILSNYYYILKLKDNKYDEYRYRKQKYLLQLDYDSVKDEKIFVEYKKMYEYKVSEIYSKLIENCEKNAKDDSYVNAILKIVDEYCIDKTIRDASEKYEVVKKYLKLRHRRKKDSIVNIIEKKEMRLRITSKVFGNVVSKKTLNLIYTNLIRDINVWLNNNIDESYFDEIYELLFIIIKRYSSKNTDPIKLERQYIMKEENQYRELKKYIENEIKHKKGNVMKGSKKK